MASTEVETGVAIRRAPDTDSPAVGFLYPGSAVMYVNKGTEWSEVKSVDVHGYIKNEFLVGGDEAKTLIDANCVPGVWSDGTGSISSRLRTQIPGSSGLWKQA